MSAYLLRAGAIGLALALGACAATPPETRVTRFHLGQPIAPGQITIEPIDAGASKSLEFQAYSGAIAAELQRIGFSIAPGLAQSELVAVFDVRRGSREELASRGSGLSIGIGGGSYGGGVGVGGGVSFPIGKGRSRDIALTELSVQIKRRSEGTVIWEGRASNEARADTPYADPDAAVRALAAALFAGFPGESGRTITIK